jgi:hypothetical protein
VDKALEGAIFKITQSVDDFKRHVEGFLEQKVQQCKKDDTTIEPETKVHAFISYHYRHSDRQ